MSRTNSGEVIKLVCCLLAVLFLVMGIGIILKFTNGGNESFKTFYVRYDGTDILSTDTETQFEFEGGQQYYFEVNYPLDIGVDPPRDYSVKVVANSNINFDYTVDGKNYSWANETHDLSGCFALDKQEKSFTLFVSDDVTLQTVLEQVYDGKTVTVRTIEGLESEYLYTLVVSSYNEKITYRINFCCIVQQSESPPESVLQEWNIQYFITGDGTNLADVSVDRPDKAVADELVLFSVSLNDEDYFISEVTATANGEIELTVKDGVYSFAMPQGNVIIRIVLAYEPEILETTQYQIEYESMGSGSGLDVQCPSHARAGEQVTFTAYIEDLSSEYADWEPTVITKIRLQLWDDDEEEITLGSGSGTFTFTMPECDVTILFYLSYEKDA